MAEARDPLPAQLPSPELLAFPQPRQLGGIHLHFSDEMFPRRVNTHVLVHAGCLEGTAPRERDGWGWPVEGTASHCVPFCPLGVVLPCVCISYQKKTNPIKRKKDVPGTDSLAYGCFVPLGGWGGGVGGS